MPIPDRQKQRREYLRKKAIAHVITGGYLLGYLYLLLQITVWLFGSRFIGGYYTGSLIEVNLPMLMQGFLSGFQAGVTVCYFLGLVGLTGLWIHKSKCHWDYGQSIPYVAPVNSRKGRPPDENVSIKNTQETVSLETQATTQPLLLSATAENGNAAVSGVTPLFQADRRKQRQDYLRKKSLAFMTIFGCAGGCLLLIFQMVDWFTKPYPIGCPVGEKPPLAFLPHLVARVGGVPAVEGIISFLMLLCLSFLLVSTSKHQWQRASAIPYVPPVSKQQENLPAEEILVRASQEPEQEQSIVLLRAAENADTPAEELLRVSIAD